jgi:hypothetical protein
MAKNGKSAKRGAARSRAAIDEGRAVRNQTLSDDEPPPFGASWKNLYAAVLLNLAALVALFYVFTRAFG